MALKIAHFYHVWAEGAWSPAASEHAQALAAAGLPPPFVGVVGPERDRQAFRDWAQIHGWQIAAEANTGYEQVTLSALRTWLAAQDQPAAVLYAHAKGARTDLYGRNSTWRRKMTQLLVGEWETCIRLLEHHDAVGCCWRNRAEFPQVVSTQASGVFCGNFWWATSSYLRKLPALGTNGREDAEGWLGLATPDVIDMLPHWPICLDDGTPWLVAGGR